MLTIFANMRINSDERLQHLKESFESFESESDDWLINIRGTHREQALAFLKPRLEGRATFFELLDDSRGWIENALEILPHAKHPYVFYWLEDHINIAPRGHLREVVQDMQTHGVQILLYSWWRKGWAVGKYEEQQKILGLSVRGTIESGVVTVETWKQVLRIGQAPYLVSLASIFEKSFFEKLLRSDRTKLPFACTTFLYRGMTFLQKLGINFNQKSGFNRVNALLRYLLRRFSHETPFDLEKSPERFDFLPIKTGFPMRELFVCIDDDCEPEPHGYSLVSRGLYPLTERLLRWNISETLPNHDLLNVKLKRLETISERYCFYGIKNVRATPVREHLSVISGHVKIIAENESIELKKGEGAQYYTNIPHSVLALEDTEVIRYIPKTGLAPHYFSA